MLSVVGNYILGRELGSGGMGIVYAAHHRVLGHAVAVKMLRADTLQRAELERFFNEARAAMAIAHPSIVQVYDVGMAEDGRAFIAMELLDGEPLAQHLDAGTLPVRVAVEYARQLAAALDAAHTAGIVHRDLKPANVIVCRDGRLKLVDFGIAKLESSVGLTRTATGVVLGTPSYMSPEQCAGQRDLDARSDLYALGCVIFAMLTGGPPFHGETGAVIGMHQFVAPPRLRTRCPSATPALENVVEGLLAKSPADRFQSARAVAAALAAPDVAELAATPGVEPTADLRPGELAPAPASVRLERTPPPPAHVSLAPAPAPAPTSTAAVPRRSRRAPWIVGLLVIAGAATALLLWQCNARESTTQVAATTPDAAPAPPPPAIDAAVTVVVTETVDARVATAVDARVVGTARRPDAKPAITTARIETLVPPSPPDAAPTPTVVEPTSKDDDDVSVHTFVSDKGHRLKFGSDKTVTKTGSGLAKPVTGTFSIRPRKRELRIQWDRPGEDGVARERFQRISCGLDRIEWADASEGRHSDGETYNEIDPPCSP